MISTGVTIGLLLTGRDLAAAIAAAAVAFAVALYFSRLRPVRRYAYQVRAITTGCMDACYDGDLAQITDPLGRVSSFEYDDAGRMIAEHLPGGRSISYTYDANSNVTSITPPSRPAHNFAFNPLGMLTAQEAPQEGASPRSSTYEYATPDHDLTKITRPSGDHADYAYDSAGRLASLTEAQGQSSFAYSPTSGNLTSLIRPTPRTSPSTTTAPCRAPRP